VDDAKRSFQSMLGISAIVDRRAILIGVLAIPIWAVTVGLTSLLFELVALIDNRAFVVDHAEAAA